MKRVYFAVGQGVTYDGKPIKHQHLATWRSAACKRIADTFGGLSTVNMLGWWNSPTSSLLVHERSWGIEVFTDSHTAESALAVAQWLKTEFRQESILLVVQSLDSMRFV